MNGLRAGSFYFNIERMTGGMFVAKVREALQDKGLSAYKLAQETGSSEGHVYNVLGGKREPTADLIEKWAPILGVDAEELHALADADRLGEAGVSRLLRFLGAPGQKAPNGKTAEVLASVPNTTGALRTGRPSLSATRPQA